MKSDSLEEEFAYHRDILRWAILFKAIRGLKRDRMSIVTELESVLLATGVLLLARGDLYNFISRIFGVGTEGVERIVQTKFRCWEATNVAIVFARTYKILQDSGITEPQKIADKILYPAIESISLEEELQSSESLQQKWANLLASAAKGESVHPRYLRIMSELSPVDAKVLDTLYSLLKPIPIKEMAVRINILEEKVEESCVILQEEGLIFWHEEKKIQLARLGEQFLGIVNSNP